MDEGGGAFYGPKIDLKVRDALGREWQLSTIQFDFNLPERFDLTYIGEDGQPHQPYMVHRALLGSMERFFGMLIEHYAGAFPVWLVAGAGCGHPHRRPARGLCAGSRQESSKPPGCASQVDDGPERMQAKIRNAQTQKIPYMLVVGDKEVEAGAVALRLRSGENPGAIPLDEFIQRALKEIEEKR